MNATIEIIAEASVSVTADPVIPIAISDQSGVTVSDEPHAAIVLWPNDIETITTGEQGPPGLPGPPGPPGPPGGGGGGGITEAPVNNIAYGRRNVDWTQVLMAFDDIVDGGNF
jgi:hypothetical protein